MRNVSDQTCTENQNTHLVFNLKKNRAVYEILWKKNCRVGHVTDDVIRRIGYRRTLAILTAFPRKNYYANEPQ
jgi:hypothetical protein